LLTNSKKEGFHAKGACVQTKLPSKENFAIKLSNFNRNKKNISGADPGGWGAHPARAPPKIGKNMIFWRKIVIFHTKYPKNVRASLRNWKKYDFLA
jgi:hypothetical protein